MPAIAINTQYVPLTSNNEVPQMTKGHKSQFYISSLLEDLNIRQNDLVIITTPISKNDLMFECEGYITKVLQTKKVNNSKPLKKNKDKYEHYFSLEISKVLKRNNLLSDLEYSLKSIYRFNNPLVHFQQQFRELPKQDYDTIINGFVYYSRTAFGKLINSIPRQNKLEFMLQAMDNFSTVDFKNISLYEGLEFLYNYIDRRILSRGKILIETNNMLKDHLGDILPQQEVGFYNPQNSKTDNLSKQSDIFERLFKLQKESDVRRLIKKSISEDFHLEERFMQIFKQQTWPIDLTV